MNTKSTAVEGGMQLTCTGINVPKKGQEKNYNLVFHYAEKFHSSCDDRDCKTHTRFEIDAEHFNFTEAGDSIAFRTPFFNKCYQCRQVFS